MHEREHWTPPNSTCVMCVYFVRSLLMPHFGTKYRDAHSIYLLFSFNIFICLAFFFFFISNDDQIRIHAQSTRIPTIEIWFLFSNGHHEFQYKYSFMCACAVRHWAIQYTYEHIRRRWRHQNSYYCYCVSNQVLLEQRKENWNNYGRLDNLFKLTFHISNFASM